MGQYRYGDVRRRIRPGQSDAHAKCLAQPDAKSNADLLRHAVAFAHRLAHANSDRDSHPYSKRDAHAKSDADALRHAVIVAHANRVAHAAATGGRRDRHAARA